ncbi:hydrophobic/amphiphilic exporter-1, HAE1 family [Natronincola peptidivorans]|uniref:Hydrophobic/amphiphilic exporter-1, HAE1 family n=1 Tax=Natronincola peptidivorans TaxID=426128 RepID=A0A1I0FNN0_9FIRM|nr:efflux RND transporter permease subunit [Natronincola peptidivorans]SET59112.1 hydrophobic/amphiphilic exporter-1, HAE1 family [Natronincola peptidivorans]
MKISDIAIKRPVSVIMLVMMIIVLGAVSFMGLNLDFFPDIAFPMAVVITEYDGVGPQEIETIITRPVEQVMGTVDNFKSVSSVSSNGMSMVMVEFTQGTNMDYAALQMRESVDMVKGMWPNEVRNPMIFQYDMSMIPIIQFGMSYGDDLAGLKTLAEDHVRDRLERINGVAAVDIYGGLEDEIKISIIPHKMQGYDLSLNQVSQALRMENLSRPGGLLTEGKYQYTVRTTGEFDTIDEIRNLPIATSRGIIRLSDIAEVTQGYKDAYVNATMNGDPTVLVQIRKQSGFNTVRVSDSINDELDLIKEELSDVEFRTIFDQADFVKESLGSVTRNAFAGGILAIFVLLIFLKNIRTTFIVGAAIPISIITTFILIYFSGITLNMMSLGGLALGIGMLVDSAIVVLESIFRYREEGYSRIDAAREGSKEVAMAVTASTMTTVAVFLPIAFIRDNMAIEMFRELALTVAFSLLASLVISLTLVPMLASKILKIDRNGDKTKRTPLAIIGRGFDKLMKRVEIKYEGLLSWSIGHRKTIVTGTLILFVLSIGMATLFTGAEFFPDADEGMFTVSIELPKGYTLEETSKIAAAVGERVQEFPELDYLFVLEGDDGDPSAAVIYASFGSRLDRDKGIEELLDEVRDKLQGIAGAKIGVQKFDMMQMGAGGSPITVNIKGDDLETLESLAEVVVDEVSLVPGTREVSSSIQQTVPEAQVKINRDKASQYGVSTYTLAETIQTAIMGQTVTRYRVSGEEIDVSLRFHEGWRSELSDLQKIYVTSPMGQQIPLQELADIYYGEAPASISRDNQVRQVTVTGDISGRDSRSVFVDIQNRINAMNVPNGYEVTLGGENEEMIAAAKAFALALILAILLVYMIMASQFESLLHPFIIMFTVPLAFIGIALAMSITRKPFSVPAFTGIIMLTGIVVNNAIVLVDYINTLRKRGMERAEAIRKAGPIRLRPILMTSLTTVLGLIPLALGIGEGAEQQAPMAITVIGGLSFATLLTLVFIPVVYTLFDDFKNWAVRKILKRKDKTLSA